MKKKLPEIFKNTIDKELDNNENVYYSATNKPESKINNAAKEVKKNDIREKINKIFLSTSYIYKANVKIITKDKSFSTKIIGRNKNYLITMDNQTIPIDSIIDIENE